jgi:class 3 adenylate cyclase
MRAAASTQTLDGFDEVSVMTDHTGPGEGRGDRSLQTSAEHLILALTHVPGSTAACAAHGDAETVAVLADYYALVADAAAAAGGRVVKVMGDAALVTFPGERAREAVESLRSLRVRGTSLWCGFDDRCRVEVKVGAGAVVCGQFGPPGEERPDIYGDALNRLFKASWAEFVLLPEVGVLLQ